MTTCWCGREYVRGKCPLHGIMGNPGGGGGQVGLDEDTVRQLISSSAKPTGSFFTQASGEFTAGTAGTWYVLTNFASATLDNCTFQSGLITIPEPGIWLLRAQVAWTMNAATGYVGGRWRREGYVDLSSLRIWSGANYATMMQDVTIAWLPTATMVYYNVLQDRGAGQTIMAVGTELSGWRLG